MVALVGLFKEDLKPGAIAIPALGLLMSALWYVTGAQDRYLVGCCRARRRTTQAGRARRAVRASGVSASGARSRSS